jgi:radical SAM superfamily enzyme with C-terminal helix-hairpin-helix motif
LEEFREFFNNEKSVLVSISGIKDGYAKLIKSKRPFQSVEDMKKKLGDKRFLNWLQGYKKLTALRK